MGNPSNQRPLWRRLAHGVGVAWLIGSLFVIGAADRTGSGSCPHPTEDSVYGEVRWSLVPPATFCAWDDGLRGELQYFWPIAYAVAVVPGIVLVRVSSERGAAGPPAQTIGTMLGPWTTFEVSPRVDLVIDIDQSDWRPMPVHTGHYRGVVVDGRHLGGNFIQWRLHLTPLVTMHDGEEIAEAWMSARHSGRELAQFKQAGFAESVDVVLQGGGSAWRAEARRATESRASG